MFAIRRVQGESMQPHLSDGDFLIVLTWFQSISLGDIVVAHHNTYGDLVKRVASIEGDGKYIFLASDNIVGLNSTQMGRLTKKDILGKVIYTVKAPEL
jgi:signal peptidase I